MLIWTPRVYTLGLLHQIYQRARSTTFCVKSKNKSPVAKL